ncbi:MAG TPA: MurR/RpiR family transcriptional regulator [Thermomicrobiales bacterium]
MVDQAARYRTIDCLTMIEQRLPALTGASRRVAEAIVRDPWAILGMTIYDVAAISGVSLPSVTRFCRAVGYAGFRELVQGIAQSLGRIESKDLETLGPPTSGNGLEGLASTIVKRQIDALQTTLKTLDYAAIERAVEAIANARHVTTLGHGGAYVPALGMAIKLNWAGIPCTAATIDLFSNQVIATNDQDVVIGISHQGRTRELIEMLALAKSFGATTIAITTVPQSPLAAEATISLAVLTPEVARAGTFLIAFDTIMVLADILSAAVVDRRWQGSPPNRREVIEWIETHLRVGPVPQSETRSRQRQTRRGNRQVQEGAPAHG